MAADNVLRMQAWRKKHPDATWEAPAPTARLGEHVVKVGGDEYRHYDLGVLMTTLEALDRATMGPKPKGIAAR
jgi:hypothetical protein